jgi:ligand-binding sensor domain-containing protein
VFSIILDPKEPKVVYASACSGIYKSEDAGDRFVKIQGIPSTARRTRVLMQDPQHLETVFAGTTEGLFRSDDSGKTWVRTTGPELIVNDVYVDPSDHTHVLLATDHGGVLSSHDRGNSFDPSNRGFSARQITSYVAEARRPAFVYVGVVNDKDWGGVFASDNGGLSWIQESTGLSGRDVFSLVQAPDGKIVAGTGHGIYRLSDGMWSRVDAVDLSTRGELKGSGEAKRTSQAAKAAHVAVRTKAVPDEKKPERRQVAGGFDGSVLSIVRVGDVLYAATSQGLLKSGTSGESWGRVPGVDGIVWQSVAVANSTILVTGLKGAMISADAGKTWSALSLPGQLTQIGAAAVDEFGAVWIGGREGVFISSDKGATWQSLKDLYLRDVNSIYYDSTSQRMLLTANGSGTMALSVHLPDRSVKVWETGWNLRFVRPVGDHLVGATLFDGVVVQPRMVDSAELSKR